MCIRDSQSAVPFEVVSQAEASEHRLSVEIPETEYPSIQVCLLYTSDAADDLLCVDLGGRRIIKKKNHCHPVYQPPSEPR